MRFENTLDMYIYSLFFLFIYIFTYLHIYFMFFSIKKYKIIFILYIVSEYPSIYV